MLRTFFSKPSHLLYLAWFSLFILYCILPVNFLNPAKIEVWGLILLGLLVFTLGEKSSVLFSQINTKPVPISEQRINQVVLVSSLLSLLGILCLAYDKLILSGLDYSKGLAYIREIRDIQLSAEIDVNRSIWLYLGYPFFSMAYPALMLLVVHISTLRRNVARIAQLSIFSPIIYSLLYGGRMPILILILLLVSCCFIRILLGKPFVPREQALIPKLIILSVCFIIYSHFISDGRINNSQIRIDNHTITTSDQYLKIVEKSWGAEPSQRLKQIANDELISKRNIVTIFMTSLYVTHGVITFQKIVDNYSKFRPYWGTYQIGILTPLLRVFYPSNDLVSDLKSTMLETNIYGFYATVWGALFIDFGPVGAMLFIALWGLVSGVAYQKARVSSNIGSQLALAFCYTSIPMSIFNAPFGMANSFLIFLSIIMTVFMLREISFKSGLQVSILYPVKR